jgi:hypothetical protein
MTKLNVQLPVAPENPLLIEGNTALAFSDDVATRFIGHGWNVTRVGDANDLDHFCNAMHTDDVGSRKNRSGDGSGAGAAVQFATLSPGLAMAASEFFVI